MGEYLTVILTLAISTAFGLIFKKLKIPGGILVGALIGSLIFSLIIKGNDMPFGIKLTAQVLAGTFIGSSMDKNDLSQLKKIFKPAMAMLASLLAVNIGAGVVLWKIGYADLLTSLMCMVPGGMSDIPLIAADMGCDISKIMVIHFFRLVSGLGLFPSLIVWYEKKAGPMTSEEDCQIEGRDNSSETPLYKIILMLAICAAVGLTARALNFPSGVIMFSILAALALNLLGFSAAMPLWMKRCAQLLTGAYLGCQVTFDVSFNVGIVVEAVILTILFFIINCLITGTYMSRNFNIPLKESMMILIPAGATDMALISSDMGIDSPRLVLLQVARLLFVTAFFPQICLFFCNMILF